MLERTTQGEGSGSSPSETLEHLLARYQAGDHRAVERLVDVCSPMFYRFFVSQGCRREEAEEVLQDTWLRIHRARHTYRPEAPALPWLYAIARHTRLDSFRKRVRRLRREVQVEELPDRPAESTGPAGRQPDLTGLLAQLPESQREVLVLLKGAGMTLEEVARATSSTVGSVKQKAHRAYEKLRRLLSESGFRSEA